MFIVFCNTVPSCDWTAYYLQSNNVPVVKLHAGFSSQVLPSPPLPPSLERLKVSSPSLLQDRKNLLKKFATGEGCRVLVCTDIASRGIDLTQVGQLTSVSYPGIYSTSSHRNTVYEGRPVHMVQLTYYIVDDSSLCLPSQVTHVVLFDFPNSLADYLHRVGRTGRVGCSRKCRVTSFMTHRRDIRMAWKLKVSHLCTAGGLGLSVIVAPFLSHTHQDSADRHIAIMNSRVNRQLQRLEQGVLARTRT